MSHYSWPLGDNHNNVYMDTNSFLKNCRNVTDNQFYHTVQWNCKPGYVPFNYVTNYYPATGASQEITASGAFTESGVVLNPSFCNFVFPDNYINLLNASRRTTSTGEGVRLTKLYYRINDGKWMELSPNLKNVSFDLSNNGDKVEIQATYQVWTMGNPHSPIPFVWLGDVDGLYNDNNNSFTDAVPVNPGRKYSGMINHSNGKDYNADWQLQGVSWYGPESTMLESNWTYQNAINLKNECYNKLGTSYNSWSDSDNCQIFNDNYMDKAPGFFEYVYSYGWKFNYPGFNTNDRSTGWWRSPYKSRKSMWWVYEKTFTDTYVASDIKQQQATIAVKNPTLRVVQDDQEVVFNKGSKWLNGISGQLLIDFSGPSVAFVDIYAVQKIYSEEIVTKIISGEAITSGTTNTIDVVFSNYPQLYRSKNISYYMEIFTVSNGYVNYEYRPSDTSYVGTLANGIHYYNDEPSWVSNVKIKKIQTRNQLPNPLPAGYAGLNSNEIDKILSREELYQITWDSPKDPDGHPVSYSFLIDEGNFDGINLSTSEDYNLTDGIQDQWTLRIRRGADGNSNETATLLNTRQAMIAMTDSNLALYTLPADRLIKDSEGKFINPLNMWIVPHDGRTNDYYYGTRVNLLHTGYNPIALTAVKGSTNDTVTLKILHNDYINTTVNAKIYAFMSTHPYDDSTGKYVGILYDGPIEPGYTTKTFNLYELKEQGIDLKRGHYIKYAISCKDLNQNVSPYSQEAWGLATGYHMFDPLPSASAPFLCEKDSTVFSDGTVKISWNPSIDEGNAPVNYHIYIASINKPHMNTHSEKFWVNGDTDKHLETRKYYKTINAGTSLPSKDMPYKLSLPEFKLGDHIQMWIVTKNDRDSTRYLTGYTLSIDNTGVKLNKPEIKVSNAIAYNLLEKEQADGESGNLKVYQSNTLGEDATVHLYAICKKIDGSSAGDMKLFSNVATWNLKSGEWSPITRINFKASFGEEWSNSYVRYFAVAITTSGASSYDEKDITVDAYDRWYGDHVYNEHPMPTIIRSSDELTNLHNNIYISWDYLIDVDFKNTDDIILVEGAYDPTAPKVFC